MAALTIPIDLGELPSQLDRVESWLAAVNEGLVATVTAIESLDQRVAWLTASVSDSTFVTHQMRSAIVATQQDLLDQLAVLAGQVADNTDVTASASMTLDFLGAKVAELTQQLIDAEVPQEIIDQLVALGTVITDSDNVLAQAIANNTTPA
jgi:hypothetical protein